MVTVEEIMTRNVLTLQQDESILRGMALMTENNIRHIPIVDKHHHLVGVVSHRDILRAEHSSLQESDSDLRSGIESSSIGSIMSTNLRTSTPADCLRSVGKILQQGKLGCVPITEEGVLIGIITDTDFVSVALTLIEELENFESAGEDEELEQDLDGLLD